MIWHPIVSGDSGNSDAKAVSGESAWYLGRSRNLPEPIGQARNESLPVQIELAASWDEAAIPKQTSLPVMEWPL